MRIACFFWFYVCQGIAFSNSIASKKTIDGRLRIARIFFERYKHINKQVLHLNPVSKMAIEKNIICVGLFK